MTSFLIIGKQDTARESEIQKLCIKHQIAQIDQTLIHRETSSKTSAQSIGIEEMKEMQKTLFLKPIKSPLKAVIIADAELLTPEAQNALLKVLEEPPDKTLIILSSRSKEAMLPTIQSRCQLIRTEEEAGEITAKERDKLSMFLQELPVTGKGEKLKKAEELSKDKEKLLAWTSSLIIVLHDYLCAEPENPRTLLELKLFQKLHTTLTTTNVNPRFALEMTLLSL